MFKTKDNLKHSILSVAEIIINLKATKPC